ncbi:hypothetical protein GCM10027055_19960 [Janibacter alkaliphilus]|uniref:DUF4352 domain-containing protein n=1 Tax=Janibacter alkaliphilus TaxID=1069963 RepID=A0A852X5U4_9MICO|nr:DUF4352 domain-containing protein [Janibacter alkaliphilus]NYG35554.1 hypothetical protein [Janibacter alkaliphilus]
MSQDHPTHGSQPGPGGWQPSNPPAPPRQQSWFGRHKVLTTLLGLGLLLVLCCGGAALGLSGDDPSGTSASGQEGAGTTAGESAESTDGGDGADAPDEGAAAPGDVVSDGTFDFTVSQVRDGGQQIGDDMLGTSAQGTFWLVDISVTNTGDSAQYFSDSDQVVIDEEGREHSADTEAAIYLDSAQDVFLEEINPGNTVEGTLVFDLPAGATPSQIELHDSMFSGGTTVDLTR